jgi:hypothetical protein
MDHATPVHVSQPEQRRFARYDVDSTVELTSSAGRQVFHTEDLGAGGCRITVLRPLDKGAAVTVRLTSDRTKLEASGQATVAWASQGEPYRVGLAFTDGLAEQVIPFMLALLGPVQIRQGEG